MACCPGNGCPRGRGGRLNGDGLAIILTGSGSEAWPKPRGALIPVLPLEEISLLQLSTVEPPLLASGVKMPYWIGWKIFVSPILLPWAPTCPPTEQVCLVPTVSTTPAIRRCHQVSVE